MGRKKAAPETADEILCFDEDYCEENGFIQNMEVTYNVVTCFNFIDTADSSIEETEISIPLIDNRKLQKQPYGKTPSVDGEQYSG
ncbi:hypothetical protein JK636_00315 [Clostridium sp. YIM B02515]|uniref:Transposase n=1 Tax=Clostridium rhizosphaerae TaxID=2803861 RepID=A0ABS1T4E9_9CLOT|nr:hypothetical protein [Clostridium rhizosphaerae]MBL4934194.1 hypothetical protein [Clostridium rhizosphaerae]